MFELAALDIDFIRKILLAGLLGALVGIERDLHGRPAGLRTNMIIAIGSCLFTILSTEAFGDEGGVMDPTRIASQIVVGVGFLGAGVVLKDEKKVMGLTTAATIWMVAAIGMAVGSDYEWQAAFVTIFAIAAIVLLEPLSKRLEKIGNRNMKKKGKDVIKEG